MSLTLPGRESETLPETAAEPLVLPERIEAARVVDCAGETWQRIPLIFRGTAGLCAAQKRYPVDGAAWLAKCCEKADWTLADDLSRGLCALHFGRLLDLGDDDPQELED